MSRLGQFRTDFSSCILDVKTIHWYHLTHHESTLKRRVVLCKEHHLMITVQFGITIQSVKAFQNFYDIIIEYVFTFKLPVTHMIKKEDFQ